MSSNLKGHSGVRRRFAGPGLASSTLDGVGSSSPGMSPLLSPCTYQLSPGMSPLTRSSPLRGTPRSTLGSPLTSHAALRSGIGDLGAGPRRRMSLSEVEVLPWLCCMAPAIMFFLLFGAVTITGLFFPSAFDILSSVLTFLGMLWVSNMAFSAMWGAIQMRQYSEVDWNALLDERQDGPDAFDVMHIVILPNYMENEAMLQDTLENIGSSPMALDRIRVILAMEAREGQAAQEKAERLMQRTEHLFVDIFATYHPPNIPGEVPGKSSNTQYAYREALRRYNPILQGCDLTRVFLTVSDADTLWHPQYFSAITYSALQMTPEQRAWMMWQSPMLLTRNIASVPALTRATAGATLIFELSGISNQVLWPAFAFSSYSLTLALASHPEVDGWDADVIAEDHHMYLKCFFAALWEQAHVKMGNAIRDEPIDSEINVKLCMQPVFLPTVSYLVESDGYISSLRARFTQARRHTQGIVELGYALLQYTRLAGQTTIAGLPWRTNLRILSIVIKLIMLHIIGTAQCAALVWAAIVRYGPKVVGWIMAGGMNSLLHGSSWSAQASDGWKAMDVAQQALLASFANVSCVMLLYSFVVWLVQNDLIEGRYYKMISRPNIVGSMPPVGEGDETETPLPDASDSQENQPEDQDAKQVGTGEPVQESLGRPLLSFVEGPFSLKQRIGNFLFVFNDTSTFCFPSMFLYGALPGLLASWSLIRRGTDFEYIVAAKPE